MIAITGILKGCPNYGFRVNRCSLKKLNPRSFGFTLHKLSFEVYTVLWLLVHRISGNSNFGALS